MKIRAQVQKWAEDANHRDRFVPGHWADVGEAMEFDTLEEARSEGLLENFLAGPDLYAVKFWTEES